MAAVRHQFHGYASRHRFIGLAALGYAVVATAWVLLSDRLLTGFNDIATIAWLASVKGLIFVAVTTTLLVLALYFVPPPPQDATALPGRPWPLAIGFLVVACVIVVGTLVTYQTTIAALRSDALLAVTSVAAQKAEQVALCLDKKRAKALAAAGDPTASRMLASWTAHPDAATANALSDTLRRMQTLTSSSGVYLVAADSTVLLGSGPPLTGTPQLPAELGRAALTGQVELIDMQHQPQPGRPSDDLHFGYAVPVTPAQAGVPQRLVLFDFDAARSLFSTLNGWPVPSQTGESVLVREGAAGPVLLTPLRDSGLAGFGRPLRVGTDALTASAPVAGSPWRVVAKLDSAEALGGVPKLLLLTGVGRMAILAAALASFALLWQRLRLRMALAEVAHGEELLMAEARFRATFDQAAVGLAHVAPDGRFLRVNQKICETTGYSRDQLVGRSAQDFVLPEQREQVAERLRSLAAGEIDSYTDDDRRYVDAGGRVIELSVTVSMVHDRAEPPYFLAVAQEVGARKRAEADLRRLTAELEMRVTEAVAAREAAQERAAHGERIQALGQLAGGIAHDFNNVLQAVVGAATLIERRPGDEAGVRRLARLAIEAVERGASTTRRLLAFGHRGNLSAEALDTAALLGDLREILVHTLDAAIDVKVELEPGVPPLFADKGQLETALVNLATNARDAMPAGGRLTLSAKSDLIVPGGSRLPTSLAPGRYVRLTVADTGVGMDAGRIARACEPFFTTKGLGAGTGLGLSMTKGFVEQSGGALSVESHLGQGTAITLWLPAAGSESARVTTDSRVSLDAVAASNAVTPARVLLVDDEELVRKLVAEQLQDAGYDVLAAPNGIEALTLLAAGESVDAVITDLSMPGMDGLAVIRAVRKRYPGLPALLLTGYAGDGSALAVGGAVGGAFSLLRKPVTGAQLIDRLGLVLTDRSNARLPQAGSISPKPITSPPLTAASPPSAAMAHRAGTPPARGGIALPPHR